MKIEAVHINDIREFRKSKIPGSIHCSEVDEWGEVDFWYCCPCGCGAIAPLSAGVKYKPPSGPSWEWNGSKEAATLHPSVNHEGHWHGWLRNGEWTKE